MARKMGTGKHENWPFLVWKTILRALDSLLEIGNYFGICNTLLRKYVLKFRNTLGSLSKMLVSIARKLTWVVLKCCTIKPPLNPYLYNSYPHVSKMFTLSQRDKGNKPSLWSAPILSFITSIQQTVHCININLYCGIFKGGALAPTYESLSFLKICIFLYNLF